MAIYLRVSNGPARRSWSRSENLVYDGDVHSFYVDDMEILKVRYMPLDFSGIGFYPFGKQTLVVDEMTFTQN